MFIELLLLFQQRHTHRATYNTDTQRYTHIQNTTSHSTETYIETYPLTTTNFYSVETYPHTAQRYKGAYRELKKYTEI